MENEEKSKIQKVTEKPIKDMVSLYFWIRQKIIEVKDSYNNYELMMESISIGCGFIDDESIREEVSVFLKDERNYPKITDMEIQGNKEYSIGSGTLGTISVRPEDLKIGKQHLLDQQCNNIIPKLRILDNKIMHHLIKIGVIPKTSYNLDNVLINGFEALEKELE